ncbi:SDR family oxidoreductase [Methylocaldum sp. RMAD-M]|uniref:SDR family oxidoreductase n=1 Tax=Methylocaldum sp. RMAD-M TaxID=2806557 RepID=UPI001B60B5F6|nr:SDR family oxidoreductase [Methylocaldum sp. RMAD-M]MBP1150393.1 short-subunit dehydrogenase [Methylocaldum sp. RMAD-M]
MNSLLRTVIFGATSAIAQEVARQLVARGSSVYCIGRNPEKLEVLLNDLRVRANASQIIEGQSADLENTDCHEALLISAVQALGTLDAILIAHGSLSDQTRCQASASLTIKEIHTNALSAISLLTLAANVMESQQRGVIAAISSVAGDRGRQSNYVYGAAKGMLSLFLQGLRNRLTKKGVAVVTVKPGFVDTPMTAAFDKSGLLWTKPDIVARGIVRAMERGDREVYLPEYWRWIMLVIRHIPECIFVRMSL